MRYKITIEYDGTNLLGWQKQLDGPTVQEYLETALRGFAKNNLVEVDDVDSTEHSLAPNAWAESASRAREDVSTGKLLQSSNSIIGENKGFSEENGVDSTEHSLAPNAWAESTSRAREDVSTGKLLQSSNSIIGENKGFSEENGVDSTEHSTGAYSRVREDVSTGKLLQSSNKTLIQGAGRTDAGVHALTQVAHFDLKEGMTAFRIREAFNAHLKLRNAPVAVLEVEEVNDDFHARFSAVGRGYIYRILNRRAPSALLKDRAWWVPVPLDVEKMRQGAQYLIGHHDFSSFRAAACQALSPLKTLDKIDISQHGEEIVFEVEARSFLHHQVRNMVGTLKMVGDGHLHPEDIKTILEAKNRCSGGITAPAHGLYLSKVVY